MSQEFIPPSAVRPATVKAAIVLQWVLVGTLLLIGAVAIVDAIHYDSQIDQAARAVGAAADDVAFERSSNVAGALFSLVPVLLLAVWLGIAAWRMRRGSNVARILALVGLGAPLALGVLACVGGSLVGMLIVGSAAFGPDMSDFADEDADYWSEQPFYDELDRLSGDGWSLALDAIGTVATLLALLLGIATLILLLVRTSNRYFRLQPVIPGYPYGPYWPGPGGSYPYYPVPPVPFWYAPPPAGEVPPYQPPQPPSA